MDLYTQTTQQIKITVRPAPIPENSDPERSVFAFSYTIRIENTGEEVVQLLERHWIIRSAEAQIAEVVGPGVVGLQPTLKGRETFEYTSGAVIHDPVGSMEGTYTFSGADGRRFRVTIPRFDLIYELVLH
jgi:ApaG protein